MGKIILILGGARSGKSNFAIKLAQRRKCKVGFVPTCIPLDKEMKERIKIHKKTRPGNWETFEADKDMLGILKKITPKFKVTVIDCLTLFISGLMMKKLKESRIKDTTKQLLEILIKSKNISIVVSNEVGLGIVPGTKMGRDFRDIAGRINQIVAKAADEVYFLVSGIPWRIK